MTSYGQTSSTLWGPTLVVDSQQTPSPSCNNSSDSDILLEISVHTLPKQLQREFNHVFAEQNLPEMIVDFSTSHTAEFLAIPTNQKALHDLVATGDAVELEKDRLLNVFMRFARKLCDRIVQAGYWADFIDPCSGLPMLTRNCNKVYSEVDGMECCLNYKSYNAGFCKVLTHPRWGSAVYPATIFTWAPRHLILQYLQDYSAVQVEDSKSSA